MARPILRASWSFDGNVADPLVQHVRQSVPMYDAGHELVYAISDYFVHQDGTCYEIGTSTGELLRAVRARDAAAALGQTPAQSHHR